MYQVYQNQAAAAYSYPYFFSFLSLQFSTLKFFVTLFSRTMRPKRLKLGTHMDSGQMYHVYQTQAAALICPFISSFFFLFNFQHWNFWSHFSWKLWGLEDWNLVHTWTRGQMYHMYQNQAAATHLSLYFFLFLSLQFSTLKFLVTFFLETVRPRRLELGTHVDTWADVSSVPESGFYCLLVPLFLHFFSLQFSTLKHFVTLFSRTMRPKRLKLGTHMDSGQMYHVYQNQAAALICPFISSFFFLFNFQHWNVSSHFSRELGGLKDWNLVHTWTVGRCIMSTRIRLLLLICPFNSSFFFLVNFQHWNFWSHFSSETVRPRSLKLGRHVSCVPESGFCFLFVPLFLQFFFSPIFNTDIFRHTFLGYYEA